MTQTPATSRAVVTVMLCCNNNHNGSPLGKLLGIAIDDAIKLESHFYPAESVAPRLHREGKSLRVGRSRFAITSYREWVGNWCWDCVGMTPDEAARLLAHLQDMRFHGEPKFVAEHGESILFDKWQAGERITADDLSRVLVRDGEEVRRGG